jgi:hypothetical protein
MLDGPGYAALLGYYLGDGCISRARNYFAFRVSCDATYPAIIDDVERTLQPVRPRVRVFRVGAPGTVVVQAHWKHWPCLFPQHGPGRKHERPIVLERWQEDIVEAEPAAFLRGLFHSDGSRAANWTTRVVAGETKRYDYPRWQFPSLSPSLRGLRSSEEIEEGRRASERSDEGATRLEIESIRGSSAVSDQRGGTPVLPR